MPSTLLEIVEDSDGKIVLQPSGGKGEPLITVQFSEASKALIPGSCLDIAKVMIQAGVQAAAYLHQQEGGSVEVTLSERDEADNMLSLSSKTLH